MKILFVTQFLPYPLDTGGKIKTYRTIKLLSKRHQIYLISFVERKPDLKWEKEVKKLCYGLKTFVAPVITTSHKELKRKALLGILNPKPFRVQKYFLKGAAGFIQKLTEKENFDAVHCDHETSIQYLPYVFNWKKKLKVYDEVDIASEGLFGYVKHEGNLVEKLAYWVEAIKFWFYERKKIFIFDKVLTISQLDKKKLVKWGINPKKIVFLPVPFRMKSQFRFGSKCILFIGLLSWWPNKDAILWFYHNIFPFIKEKIPQVRFYIVGANPSKKIRKIGQKDSSVVVTGYVKEAKKYFKKAGVFIAPIRAGAGVRIKILDAFSYGVPVVATKAAVKGIRVKNKREVLVEDEEKKFAKSVVKILKDEELARKLSLNGVRFIKRSYNQKKAQEVLEQVYPEKGK